MSVNKIDAFEINPIEKIERELITTEISVDVAVVLPVFDNNVTSDFQIDFDYNAIVSSVNDYINRNVIDERIEDINYSLTIPQLPDQEATQNLRDALTGEKDVIKTSQGNVKINNKAINDEKVNMTFELSIEETVFLEGSNNLKTSSPTTEKVNDELVIKSEGTELYWENVTSNNHDLDKQEKKVNTNCNYTGIVKQGTTITKNIGDGISSGTDSIQSKAFESAKVGNNGKIYTNPHARGNGSYKIVGKICDNPTVKKLGTAGKIISYGSTGVKTAIDYNNAKTSTEKGKVIGGTVGEIGVGVAAGTVASVATTGVLVSIAAVAGVATAPVTIVVIAGCSIVAGVAASNASEKYGRDFGEKMGEKSIEVGKSLIERSKVHFNSK